MYIRTCKIHCSECVYVSKSINPCTVQILSVQNELKAVLDQRLAEVINNTKSSGVSKDFMLESVESQIQQHLDVAKEQWMKQVTEPLAFECIIHVCIHAGMCMYSH